jgi:hypothetical protein
MYSEKDPPASKKEDLLGWFGVCIEVKKPSFSHCHGRLEEKIHRGTLLLDYRGTILLDGRES